MGGWTRARHHLFWSVELGPTEPVELRTPGAGRLGPDTMVCGRLDVAILSLRKCSLREQLDAVRRVNPTALAQCVSRWTWPIDGQLDSGLVVSVLGEWTWPLLSRWPCPHVGSLVGLGLHTLGFGRLDLAILRH